MTRPTAPRAIKIPKRPTPADQIPPIIVQPSLDDHLEIMARGIFQAGLSWAMIAARWDAFAAAFDRFDIERVAGFGEFEIDRLMTTDRIVHSVKKIEGVIANARTLIALDREFGSVASYVRGFHLYADLFADASGRFAFLGDLTCYYWLFRTNNPVPVFETWIQRQPKDHPRMREMVLAGRARGSSPEREE